MKPSTFDLKLKLFVTATLDRQFFTNSMHALGSSPEISRQTFEQRGWAAFPWEIALKLATQWHTEAKPQLPAVRFVPTTARFVILTQLKLRGKNRNFFFSVSARRYPSFTRPHCTFG